MLHKISLKARALRYLSMREHSRKEMAGKLARHVAEGDDMEALLDWLQEHGYLSEARYAEALVRQRGARYGGTRVLQELQSRGIDGETLLAAKSALAESEAKRAFEVWEKKFGHQPSEASERARQMRFMQQRGFSLDIIRKIWKQEID